MQLQTLAPRTLLALVLLSPAAPPGKARALTGVTTNGELVQLDTRSGRVEVRGSIVPAGGQRIVSDVLLLPQGSEVLAAVVEIGDNRARTILTQVRARDAQTASAWEPLDYALDALCAVGEGEALAVGGSSRPQRLVELDLRARAVEPGAELDPALWIVSLCRTAEGGLLGLHARTPELEHDALVRLDRATGKTLETIRLDLPERALALELDPAGRLFATVDGGELHELDPRTGRSRRKVSIGDLRVVGL